MFDNFNFSGSTERTLPDYVEAPPIPQFKRKFPHLSQNVLEELRRCENNFSKKIKFASVRICIEYVTQQVEILAPRLHPIIIYSWIFYNLIGCIFSIHKNIN